MPRTISDMEATKMKSAKSWRDVYQVHPAANLFPLLPPDELQKLGEDIKKNGLKEAILLWAPGDNDEHGDFLVLDGRNRLDAMELVGLPIVDGTKKQGFDLDLPAGGPDSPEKKVRLVYEKSKSQIMGIGGNISAPRVEPSVDPYAYVISKNIRRRHLTKQEQADLIVKVTSACTDPANLARSVKRDAGGKLTGSEKNQNKQKAIEEGAKHGIRKRTMERSLAKAKGPTLPSRKTKTLKPTNVDREPSGNAVKTLLQRKPKVEPGTVFAKGGVPGNTSITFPESEAVPPVAATELEADRPVEQWSVESAINETSAFVKVLMNRAPDRRDRYAFSVEIRRLAYDLMDEPKAKISEPGKVK